MNYSLSTKVTSHPLDEEMKESEVVQYGSSINIGGAQQYAYIEPRQKPIDPPYKTFLAMRNELNNK